MRENRTDYTLIISPADKVRIHFIQVHGSITWFVVQYFALVNSRWRTIMRIDTCHGETHKHVYHLQGREYRVKIGNGKRNDEFTESRQFILSNLPKIKQNFLTAQ